MAYKNPPKETQFTSENQPSPEKKRVKHYKTRLKKFFIEKGIDKLIKIAEMGDINKSVTLRAIEDVKEWVYGKEADKFIHSGKIDSDMKFEVIGVTEPNKDTPKAP
jgi:hypothetical protein